MDAVKFIEERNRMCGTMSEVWGVDAAQIVKNTEEWSAAHPRKTRQKVRKATYYNKSLDEMPVVCENKVSIQAVIGKAVLDAVRGFAGGGKSDGEETPQAGWLPVYESEITGWDPALAGRDPIGGYACSKCGYEAVYSCNDEYVLSDYCPGCGARMAGGAE